MGFTTDLRLDYYWGDISYNRCSSTMFAQKVQK